MGYRPDSGPDTRGDLTMSPKRMLVKMAAASTVILMGTATVASAHHCYKDQWADAAYQHHVAGGTAWMPLSDLGTAFLIGGFSSLMVNLFFFMPFNVGSKEGGLYVIFAALGLSPRLGVAAAVLSRLRELSWIAIGLLLSLGTRRK